MRATLFNASLRSGFRVFISHPMLSVVAVLTLGLGIGLSTTIFSIVNGALFKGLPFEDADRVVSLVSSRPAKNQWDDSIAVQDVVLWQARQQVFDAVGPYDTTSVNLSSESSRPERISAGRLSVGAFEALRVKPIVGRGFRQGDDRPGAPPVVLLGYDLWRDRFHGATDIIGKTIKTNGDAQTVIGVMPERFGFPELERLWLPLQISPNEPRGKGPHYQVLARLKAGVSLKESSAQAKLIASQLEHEFPDTNQGLSAEVWPFTRTVLGPEVFGFLYTALGAGVGVLIIACVNVSSLLIARASLRWREIAVRMALGAGRGHIIRQHLGDVLLLAIAGGVIGVGISLVGMRWFNNALAIDPPPFWMTFDLDRHVLLYVAAMVALASLLAGILPSVHASRVSATTVMRDDSRSSTGTRLGRFSGALVVVELAVSCGLLIAAGLMTKSVVQLKTIKMPFALEHILTMRVDLPIRQYPTPADRVRFYDRLLEKLSAIPGAEVALSDGVPGRGIGGGPVQVEGHAYTRAADYPSARRARITPRYFETFQVSVTRGRAFGLSDASASLPVAIVNDTFARTHFPGTDPIERRIRSGGIDSKEPWLTIVGIVPDLLMEGIGNNESGSGYYVPMAQQDAGGSLRIAVRSQSDTGAMAALIRSALASIDRDLPMDDLMTMNQIIQRETWFYTVFGTLFLTFGCAGLFLASVGLYGVMSFAVTQRTREMGVRSALGAPRVGLVLLVMRRSLIQLVIGLVVGVGLGLAASGPLTILLYRVSPRDPFVLTVVVITLTLTSVTASLIPAWRVTRIDPTVALAAE